MKARILTIAAILMVVAAIAFGAGTYPDKVVTITTLGGSWTQGTKADYSTGQYRDTVTKTVTTANDQDTSVLVSSIIFDKTKYTGLEIMWEMLSVSSDTLVEDDSCFPMLWGSEDGTNWTAITATTGITNDTITHASDAATAMAITPYYKRYVLTDASPWPPLYNYYRIGVRYAGANEDAATINAVWRIHMWKFKE